MLLGVNIDHAATLRQARYATMLDQPQVEPNIIEIAQAAQAGGADSITLHVREDRRHMQDADAIAVREQIKLPLNLEMAAIPEMIEFACKLKPDYVCLVPERREEITTEGGLDVASRVDELTPMIAQLTAAGCKVSMFIDPVPEQIKASAAIGAPMIELHTGHFANVFGAERDEEVARLKAGAELAQSLGLEVHAGHGLQLSNLADLTTVPHLHELNIGHTLIARALIVGLATAVKEMREAIDALEWN
ncbi:MAG: pyridoxine 5'-phosphate synthase [Akkermansia sp.]